MCMVVELSWRRSYAAEVACDTIFCDTGCLLNSCRALVLSVVPSVDRVNIADNILWAVLGGPKEVGCWTKKQTY
jgi:hypothetical protein